MAADWISDPILLTDTAAECTAAQVTPGDVTAASATLRDSLLFTQEGVEIFHKLQTVREDVNEDPRIDELWGELE